MTASSPVLVGVGVSPGVVAAKLLRMPEPATEPEPGPPVPEADRDAAAQRIAQAMESVSGDLFARAQAASGEAADILEATALMAADPALEASAVERLRTHGLPPERAVWEAAGEVAGALLGHGGYLAERSRDVLDVRDRVIAELRGRPAPGVPSGPTPFVLVARDLSPADTSTLDPAVVLALVTAEGGPTSHTAILARALGIPAVVSVGGAGDLVEGTVVLVDGGAGTVTVEPQADDLDRVARLAARGRRRFAGTGATADGVHVALLANVGDPAGARAAAEVGAEGIGLFRTEFSFLDRHEAPTAEEQVGIYAEVLAPFAGRRVVVRTLDAGADKPLPYLTAVDEPNPALGVRGLRTAWRSPRLLDDQLRAISHAARDSGAQVWVMAPMVATREEASSFVARCTAQGLDQAGVMVEIPAAALTAASILEVAHFASIGTNDLMQYTMAADRMLADLAALNDHFQPAVLQLVRLTAAAGSAAGRPVGVCGEAAADPTMACVLAGLGISSLSMSPAAIPDVAAALAGATHAELEAAAAVALRAGSAPQARRLVREALPHLAELGL